ncbi:MAG: hypothetical protein HZA60_02415 [Deltaproteobacteria bacterium]|nr:hypothetical protein [Deltaproteobacteria bacterium]
MSLDVLVGELRDILQEGRGRIERMRALGEAERSRNAELFLLLDRMDKEFERCEARLKAAGGTGLSDYDAVKFLNNMLKLEYRGILDYHLYAPAFADPGLREKFLKFGATEIEHAKMMFSLIRKMGGDAYRAASAFSIDLTCPFSNAARWSKTFLTSESFAFDDAS